MLVKTEIARNKLCPCSFGVALGVAKGLFVLLLAWAGHLWHVGLPMIHQIATVYYGYAPTITGGFYGAFWGFLGGFVFGMVVGFVYNFCLCCCCIKGKMCENKDLKK